ncbi:MAG: class I SAM-dependent methyltransferase [Nitrososphaerota archaeon]|nr:class I SAM-dependent methyltransferase [Nitrososphaerota archaeon]MDG6952854.1 class I SAM-dependent methyltransferase [Nitrososphaerota archaeon]MDG6959614.1 class I SAM-dependent methyltransferase [Nitrososphaerota archaeon]MDG6971828.1 class I SAM-dependent methyltransferase [Nitrososphaerota archaeon]MDG6976462.1 class I SAM-dependent methyltransferase [Nitrososphaerota archaeon]
MERDEFARILMSEERRKRQDPLKLMEAAGIRPGMTVADLGCGPGFFTLPLASRVGSRGLVYAVDADPVMLKHLRNNIEESKADLGRIKILEADVSETGIPARSVDAVLFANVLHDIDDKKAFLGEVTRICKARAMVIDVDWKKIKQEIGPPFGMRLAEAETKKIMSEAGLEVTKALDAGPHHYGLVSVFAV